MQEKYELARPTTEAVREKRRHMSPSKLTQRGRAAVREKCCLRNDHGLKCKRIWTSWANHRGSARETEAYEPIQAYPKRQGSGAREMLLKERLRLEVQEKYGLAEPTTEAVREKRNRYVAYRTSVAEV